jgi:hypothetical protein
MHEAETFSVLIAQAKKALPNDGDRSFVAAA